MFRLNMTTAQISDKEQNRSEIIHSYHHRHQELIMVVMMMINISINRGQKLVH